MKTCCDCKFWEPQGQGLRQLIASIGACAVDRKSRKQALPVTNHFDTCDRFKAAPNTVTIHEV